MVGIYTITDMKEPVHMERTSGSRYTEPVESRHTIGVSGRTILSEHHIYHMCRGERETVEMQKVGDVRDWALTADSDAGLFRL